MADSTEQNILINSLVTLSISDQWTRCRVQDDKAQKVFVFFMELRLHMEGISDYKKLSCSYYSLRQRFFSFSSSFLVR